MLLDKLLEHVHIRVEPFAVCMVNDGWRLRLPGPADTEFHFVLQGKGALRGPAGESFPLERYTLAIVPKGAGHALENGAVDSERVITGPPPDSGVVRLVAGDEGRADLRVACGIVHVTYGDTLGLFGRVGDVITADLSAYPQVRSAFETMLAEQGGYGSGSMALVQALMSQCLVYLLRHLADQSASSLPWLEGLEDPALAPAVDLIFENPSRGHTVASLAETASMSRSQFAERFHATFGCTPMTFLQDVRLRQAARLLRQRKDMSVDQVSHQVGFQSRSHFSRSFKEQFGLSPSEFRVGP